MHNYQKALTGLLCLSSFAAVANNGVVWRNSSDGLNFFYQLSGTAVADQSPINRVDLNWQLATSGDFNGDGEGDLLWRNSVSGVNYIYYLNQGSIVSGRELNQVPDNQWQVQLSADFNGDGNDERVLAYIPVSLDVSRPLSALDQKDMSGASSIGAVLQCLQ